MRSRSTWRLSNSRRRAVRCAVIAACMLYCVRPVRAEGGEVFLRLSVANEASQLHHPGVQYAAPGGTWAYIPRFGLSASYGLSHLLSVGIGVGSSLQRDVVVRNTVVQGYPPASLYASYLAVMVPVLVGFHFGTGGDWSAEVSASGGPAFNYWDARGLENATGTRMYPIKPFVDWNTQWFGRVSVQAEWRPGDWGALSVGPYVGMSTAHDLYIGALVEVAAIWAAGPFIE